MRAPLCLVRLKIEPLTQVPAHSKSSINFASAGGVGGAVRDDDNKDAGGHEVVRCDRRPIAV